MQNVEVRISFSLHTCLVLWANTGQLQDHSSSRRGQGVRLGLCMSSAERPLPCAAAANNLLFVVRLLMCVLKNEQLQFPSTTSYRCTRLRLNSNASTPGGSSAVWNQRART